MTNVNVTKTEASSEKISQIVGRIEDAVVGETPGSVIIACLSLCILIQKNDIAVEGLQQVLRDVSNYLCLALEGAGTFSDTHDMPLRLVN